MQFRVIVVTDPQTHEHTHTQTGPITIHYAAKLSAQCEYVHAVNELLIHGNTATPHSRFVSAYRVPTLLLAIKSRTFPRLSRTPMKNFPGPFRSPRTFKYKEKMAFTHNIQSVVHCRKFSMKQNVDVSCSEFR